ncbi:hypothetical protein HpMS107_51480 [Helicobacter pylori]
MSATAENTVRPIAAAQIKPMQVVVRGRVEASRTYEGVRYTRVMTPAADAYSRPQVVEVRSKQRLGEKGEEVTVLCAVGGYQRKTYKATDKDTGEVVTITPVDVTLDAVEQ